MSNLIDQNAYRILGLDANANQKDILKRYKEIINRLKIDDSPSYNLDLGLPNNNRTEESVNDALKRLQNPKNNLKEYFFWFSISDTVDEKALKFLHNDDIPKAIQTWIDASGSSNSIEYFYRKNLAVLYCLLLFKQSNGSYLKKSIDLWHEVVNSDKFWVVFTKKYVLYNEQTASAEIISEFRKTVEKNISDVYTDLYQQNNDSKYIKSFHEVFDVLGDKTDQDLLKPIYQSIYESIEELKGIKFEEESERKEELEDRCDNCGSTNTKKYWDYNDGTVLCDKCDKKIGKEWQREIDELARETVKGSQKVFLRIQKIINNIQSELVQLKKIGLYEENQSLVVRDHVAAAIRNSSIMIYNEAHMVDKSIELLKLSIRISGTESVKEKYESDLKIINQNLKEDEHNSLILEIPKFWSNKNILFKGNFVDYDGKIMYYKDVIAISYHGVRNTNYGVETSKSYTFSIISSKNDDIKITFSNDEQLWDKLINLAQQFIEPIVVEKLVKLIFQKGQTITIGNATFDQNGYHQKFFGGIESVYWKDTIYIPRFNGGNVILFKDEKGKGIQFTAIPMAYSNAVVLPELLKACLTEYELRQV